METIVNKIKNGIELTSDEVEKAIWNLDKVKTIEGENRRWYQTIEGENKRWYQTIEVILNVENKLYNLEYENVLTEMQENEYNSQIAIEVQEVQEVQENVKIKKFIEVNKIKQQSDRDILIEKAIQEFKEIQKENARLIEIAEAMKKEYDEKISYYTEKIQMAEEHLKGYIQSQVSLEEMKETKTEHNIKFPSAKVSISKDKEVLVKPDIENTPDNYIKIKKEVDWINYKKELIIQGGKVINKSTGEVVDVKTICQSGGELKLKIL